MWTRSLAATVLVPVFLAALIGAGAVEAKGPPRSISGGDLSEVVALPYEEQPLLHSRQSQLTLLRAPPLGDLGVGYEVYDWTWASLARAIGAPLPADDTATYYPTPGVVKLRSDSGMPAWATVDGDRNRVLRRYIALTKAGAIGPAPTILEVRLAAEAVLGEPIAVSVDGRALSPAEADAVLGSLRAADERYIIATDLGPRVSFTRHSRSLHDGALRDVEWPVASTDIEVTLLFDDGARLDYTYLRAHQLLVHVNEGSGYWRAVEPPSELQDKIDAFAPIRDPSGASAPAALLLVATAAAVSATGSLAWIAARG
ncbi:MAG: hypothetical protein GEU80_09935 [Dehalococcoidia bacterium]|nr:hypothetical protein [Dehalococcoidia bacterium]